MDILRSAPLSPDRKEMCFWTKTYLLLLHIPKNHDQLTVRGGAGQPLGQPVHKISGFSLTTTLNIACIHFIFTI